MGVGGVAMKVEDGGGGGSESTPPKRTTPIPTTASSLALECHDVVVAGAEYFFPCRLR